VVTRRPASNPLIGGSPPRDRALTAAIVAALVIAVGSFFAVDPIVDVVTDAVDSSVPFPSG